MFEKVNRINIKVVGIIFFILTTLLYLYLANNILLNSDNASILLEAKAIYEGNLFLSGWTLSTVSYLTTEIPLYILGVALVGAKPYLLHIIPAIVYSLTVFFFYMACRY